MNIFYTKEELAVLKANLYLSPHTVLLMNNPIHAYVCEGDACRERVNHPVNPAPNSMSSVFHDNAGE